MHEVLNIVHFTVGLFKVSIVKESVFTQQKFMSALETLSPLTKHKLHFWWYLMMKQWGAAPKLSKETHSQRLQ